VNPYSSTRGLTQSWLQVVTDKSRSFWEPHYFGEILESVLKLGISIAFPQNIASLGHFPQKIDLHNLQPTLFFLSTSGENSSQKNSSGGSLNIYPIHFAFNLPN
jgi:hypothetical protein